jgi:hypothetical protein
VNATDRSAAAPGTEAARRADAIVADRLRAAAAREPLPGTAAGTSATALAASLAAGSPHARRFTAEIAAAVHGTALALDAARPHPTDLWAAAEAFHADPSVWFEQAVLLGHPTHPLARSRGALTDPIAPDPALGPAQDGEPRQDGEGGRDERGRLDPAATTEPTEPDGQRRDLGCGLGPNVRERRGSPVCSR